LVDRALGRGPHPDSLIQAGGRVVELKVHRFIWSGRYSENSPLAIEECARERVARAELDIQLLGDGTFVIFHDDRFDRVTDARGPVREATASQAKRATYGDGSHPLLLDEAMALLAAHEYPKRIELDLKDLVPFSREHAEALACAAAPLKDRVFFSTPADWNLRRLLAVDPTLPVTFNPHGYIDSVGDAQLRLPAGAYGYFDAHPLARRRVTTTAEYLRDRLGGIMRQVPGLSEAHVRVEMFERMLDDGVSDAAEIFHGLGIKLDVWTLDAGGPRWPRRLARVVRAGVDIITTNTARALATEGRRALGEPRLASS
jgi:glycerophosphoryl diester phosphodiesterase